MLVCLCLFHNGVLCLCGSCVQKSKKDKKEKKSKKDKDSKKSKDKEDDEPAHLQFSKFLKGAYDSSDEEEGVEYVMLLIFFFANSHFRQGERSF